jgi:hypothetical protein
MTINAERNATKPAVVLQVQGDRFVFKKTIAPPDAATSTASAR